MVGYPFFSNSEPFLIVWWPRKGQNQVLTCFLPFHILPLVDWQGSRLPSKRQDVIWLHSYTNSMRRHALHTCIRDSRSTASRMVYNGPIIHLDEENISDTFWPVYKSPPSILINVVQSKSGYRYAIRDGIVDSEKGFALWDPYGWYMTPKSGAMLIDIRLTTCIAKLAKRVIESFLLG